MGWAARKRAILLLAALSATAAAQAPAPAPPVFARGAVTDKVTCAAAPEHDYALYLPSNFSPGRAWPVLIAFDPAARGRVPVELYREAAEKYGYIVVGSNTSRNGAPQLQVPAARAIWDDVHARFPMDERQRYFTGFSGGARVAGGIALNCQCVQGVIAHGAGYPMERQPSAQLPMPYFLAVGDLDFNHAEIMRLAPLLEAAQQHSMTRVFAGGHQWATQDVATESLEWLHLKAMQQGRRPVDASFVEAQFAQRKARAAALEAAEPLLALEQYRAATRDFRGLRAVEEVEAAAAALAGSVPVEIARKKREREMELQARLAREAATLFSKVERVEAEERPQALAEATAALQMLRHRRDKAKGDEQKVYRRALSMVVAQAFETGQQYEHRKDLVLARGFFDVVANAFPENPGAHFEVARVSALLRDRKRTLRELAKAVEHGLAQPELLERPDFAAVQGDPKFQELLGSVRAKAAAKR